MSLATSAQFPRPSSGVNPKPWSSHSEPFHIGFIFSASKESAHVRIILGDAALFPLCSNFCCLHWDALASLFKLQLDAVILPMVAHKASGPTLGMEWRNLNYSLSLASLEQCWTLNCPNS